MFQMVFNMKKVFIVILLAVNTIVLSEQIPLTIQGTVVNNTISGTWQGVNIQRSIPTLFTYKNNSVTSVNTEGYMLQAGDEGEASSNNNLDGSIITGNKFTWNGTDLTSITHGIFTGYNINTIIKYNYLDRVPMGIIRKSNGMTDLSGVVSYNIIRSPNVGFVVKGMNGIKIYNNTFYSSRSKSQTTRGLIEIYVNESVSPSPPSTRTVIKNNIFYTKYPINNIIISETEDLTGFECDFNVYYCESGTPMFSYLGSEKTFAEWQALGYDKHSVVRNPNFVNFVDLIPASRLDYGTDLGTNNQDGLAVNAVWGNADPALASQNSTWQVGAFVQSGETTTLLDSIYIYPDPIDDSVLWIKLGQLKNSGNNMISIYNLKGQKIYEDELSSEELLRQISLKSSPPGIYIMKLQGPNMKITRKFIKN